MAFTKNGNWWKLRDGSWGAVVSGYAKVGDSIQVSSKNNSNRKTTMTVSKVIFNKGGKTGVAFGSGGESTKRSSNGCYSGICRSCGSREILMRHGICLECDQEGE